MPENLTREEMQEFLKNAQELKEKDYMTFKEMLGMVRGILMTKRNKTHSI